ncbi:MAG: DUF1592 domain-containing protein [Phycisphaera sp.]|nr:DUF1592 domain-containing protein [Phycisphaera sp.]
MKFHRAALVLFCLAVSASAASGAAPSFEKDIQPFLDAYCVKCHNETKHKGDLRFDTLSKDVGADDAPHWAEVMERISSGEMPPEEQRKRPTAEQGAAVVDWLSARIHEGEAKRLAKRDRVTYNRLTRDEYVNTVRDLIGVQYDASDPGGLLEDAEWHGFERLGSVLTLSPSHIDKYMTAAEVVLNEAYPDKPIEYAEATKPAETVDPKYQPEHYARLKEAGLLDKVRFEMWPGDLFRGGNAYNHVKFPGPGVYEITVKLSGLKPPNGPAPRLHVYEANLDRVLFEQDVIAPEDQPTTVTFRAHFPSDRGPNIQLINMVPEISLNFTHRSARHGRKPFVSIADGRMPWQMKLTDEQGQPRYPFLIIDSTSMRGPIVTEQEQQRRDEYMPKDTENMDQVRAGLAAMAKRAFRRPLYNGELDVYVGIVDSELAAGEKFRDAVKSAMTAILCSKSFLFIAEGDENVNRNTLNDWEIATRLSYLLWSTMPDDELFKLAEQGKLHDKAELERQLDRMLADPRAERFAVSFPTQWLRLRKVGMFPPDKKLYPNYDSHLEQSMIGETTAFFGEVLRSNLTLREFLDSDWTMVNPRLAKFYGIPNITRDEFQRVKLDPECHRGGILTQAAILSLTSDGTRQRPVHRGAWVSEAIFGKTPPPPPANVAPIEPTPVGQPKATLRMKLDAHKTNPTCAACHRKIDPLGLAFDNYNAIGAWRTHERVEGAGDDPVVDASGELPDGRTFKNAEEFKQLLLDDIDAFNKTFVEKLATYGMRRTVTFDDREGLKAIAKFSRDNDYRVRDIVRAFVLSDLFQKR